MKEFYLQKNLLTVLLAALTLVSSCATLKGRQQSAEVKHNSNVTINGNAASTVYVNETSENDEAAVEDNEDEPDDENLISEIDDAEFCKDNIYGEYLKKQYLSDHPKAANPENAFQASKKARRRRVATKSPYDQREVEALFYARTRMVGEMVPYFGSIPVVTNPRVEHWIRYFKNNGRKSFLKWLVRGESVGELVLPILKEQGLPPEFIFLSMVESGFSNSAYSHAKATGPWQFMPGTAKLYGLEMNMFRDERRDPAKSTQAAARHLRDLYEDFGDWYLAMAAYNAGPGRVRSAMRMTGSNDFWKLADSAYLPVETKNYVPKVLAALQLSSNPAGHGFEVSADPLDKMPVETVSIKGPCQISEIATKLQIPEKLLRHWNPELINSITPPLNNSKTYPLRVASNLVSKWSEIEPTLEFMEVKDVLLHKIRRGDTLAGLASRYRVESKRILALNPSLKSSKLKIGTEVAIPTTQIIQKSRSSKKQASKSNQT